MTWIKNDKFEVTFSEPYYPMYHGMLKMDKEHISHMMIEALKKAFAKSKFVVYPFDHNAINEQVNKIEYMEKIEIKMARFIELSKKFTVTEDMLEEISDIKDLMEPEFDYSRATLTTSGITDGRTLWGDHGVPTPEDREAARPKEKSERERLEEGVTRRWKVYEEYKEYLELQTMLNDYFKAAAKL